MLTGSQICKETGIGHTNAVGAFTIAKSPYGVEEMSGNVWEWCQSQWKNYDYRPDDGRERLDQYEMRLLRGGSFYDNIIYLSCFFRFRYNPFSGDNYWGFRVFRPYPPTPLHPYTSEPLVPLTSDL